ncbi:MAG: hypothetical protein RLP44_32045 [Aggregatilineales bacterium]
MMDEHGFNHIQTREDAERHAASKGIALTARDWEEIERREHALRASRKNDLNTAGGFTDRFVSNYLVLLEAIERASEVLFTLIRAVILAFGIPLALILLLIVEQQRVVHGLMLFEGNRSLASFGAWAIVLLNLVLEFTIEYVEVTNGYVPDSGSRFSLRIWFNKFMYFIGATENWTPQILSPANRYRQLLRLVTFTILALALAGSMKDVIAELTGPWYQALANILLNSDLMLITTWIGGLLFAAVAVMSVQGLARYIAVRCVEIIEQMEKKTTINTQPVDTSSVAIQYILSKVAKVEAKQNVSSNGASPFLVRED